ncbi:MAG: hypothetical protein WBN40_00225 [Pseudomonadales bacterium]
MSKENESTTRHAASDSKAAEARLLQRVREQLDADVALQDASTRSALNRARTQALAAAGSGASKAVFASWQWPAGLVAAGLAAVLLLPLPVSNKDAGESALVPQLVDAQTSAGLIEELDSDTFDDTSLALLDSLADTDLAFYNDIAFIEWLDEQPEVIDEEPGQAHGSIQAQSQHVG